MKAMLLAFLATWIIAVGSNLILERSGFSASEQAAGPSVRLGG